MLTLGVAVISVRWSLGSLVLAAKQAQRMSPLDTTSRFDVSGMPHEAASLAIAINGLLDRVRSLVSAQRLFIARAAHELRTPLSVIMLELERIDDARVRRLEADVRGMSETVDHLLTLARLEGSEAIKLVDLDMGRIATELVSRLEDRVLANQHKIKLELREPARIAGDATAIREAMRNLIENAVRHTPPGTDIGIDRRSARIGGRGGQRPGPGYRHCPASSSSPSRRRATPAAAQAWVWRSSSRPSSCTAAASRSGAPPAGGAKFTLSFVEGASHPPEPSPVVGGLREFA